LGIAFGSINTGLPKDIVKQIIEAERIPIKKMEERKGKFEEKKLLVNELYSIVEKLRGDVLANSNSRSLRELQVVTNEEIVNVSADKNTAEPGTYQFEVVQMAQKSSAMSSGFSDPEDDYLGVGYIQYYLPDGTLKDVYVDVENSSLKGVAKLINKDNKNGMRAMVVNDGTGSDTPWRLIVSLEETGDEFVADFPYFYFVDGEKDFYLEYEREAHDTIVKLDGFEIETQKNKITDLIPGVTIDLKRASPGEEFTIQISEDVEKIADKIEGIIGSINEVLKFIHVQNDMDENTDSSRTLGGDVTLQTIESRLRSIIFQPVQTEFGMKRIGDLGIRFQRDGLISFDRSSFEGSLDSKFKVVSQIMHGYFTEDGKTTGFMDNLKGFVDGALKVPNGILLTRRNGIGSKIDQIDQQIANKERLLKQREQGLKDKFSRLEGTISRIRSQGAGIAALGQAADPVTKLG
jgi:flagellar hook-associated protein 2